MAQTVIVCGGQEGRKGGYHVEEREGKERGRKGGSGWSVGYGHWPAVLPVTGNGSRGKGGWPGQWVVRSSKGNERKKGLGKGEAGRDRSWSETVMLVPLVPGARVVGGCQHVSNKSWM